MAPGCGFLRPGIRIDLRTQCSRCWGKHCGSPLWYVAGGPVTLLQNETLWRTLQCACCLGKDYGSPLWYGPGGCVTVLFTEAVSRTPIAVAVGGIKQRDPPDHPGGPRTPLKIPESTPRRAPHVRSGCAREGPGYTRGLRVYPGIAGMPWTPVF